MEVPPLNFNEQFAKDLLIDEVTKLNQLKWIFDGKKFPEGYNFKGKMEEELKRKKKEKLTLKLLDVKKNLQDKMQIDKMLLTKDLKLKKNLNKLLLLLHLHLKQKKKKVKKILIA